MEFPDIFEHVVVSGEERKMGLPDTFGYGVVSGEE